VAQIARGLVAAGDDVHVWSPEPAEEEGGSGVDLHALQRGFDESGRRALETSLREHPDSVVLLQYVPGAIGGVNPSFLRWVTRLPGRLWVMFHEVIYPFERGQPLRLSAYAAVTHVMAFHLLRHAERVLCSTPAWERFLLPLGARTPPVWLPVTSNLSSAAPSDTARAAWRSKSGIPANAPVVAHFGTYGARVTRMLGPALGTLLRASPTVHLLLLGRSSREFATTLDPSFARQVHATGELPAEDVAAALASAEVVLLPFPDGVTSRRTTMMAALSLGKAVVTNSGEGTEAVWSRERCVVIAGRQPEALAREVLELLGDPTRREELGRNARRVYTERFSTPAIVDRLRALAGAE
jgi:glycosyltransferase involved in cell wall biosynthesis